MKVLVVFQEIPEDIKFYYGEVDATDFEILERWNNHVVNEAGWNEPFEVLDAVLKKLEKAPTPLLLSGPITVINTGFIL